ncbi:Flp family type IVb pilin [Novosphingobium sp.]|uniref:Flp family type IVb pilin n=1 Tax=Novosphingobium sp. TaxID=1874826 RepID=UPI0025F20D03|nr:Flp family type IVb pilin [Novosphingobium sp.]MCC6926073.1 Flp family type IVb pilin [Novosphingobium sp.]
MKTFVKRLLRDKRGTSAIEMGLICSLIILAMMTALENFAGESQLTWNTISSKAHEAMNN